MNGDVISGLLPLAQAFWPRSLREAHGEAARVQGGAELREPVRIFVCGPNLQEHGAWQSHLKF